MKENVEVIFKLSLPTFILLGLAEITSYYRQFHFPILEYLSFSEIITVFLSNLYAYTSLFLLFAIFFLLDNRYYRGSLTIIIMAFILVSVFNIFSGDFRFDTYNDIITVLAVIFLVFALLIFISRNSVLSYIESLSGFNKKYLGGAFIFLFLLVIASAHGKYTASHVKNNHIYSGTIVIGKTDTLVSNDSIYFIGKSDNYIFFYNQKSDNVVVYPINGIEKILYKSKNRR
jgi:hypothetical protein